MITVIEIQKLMEEREQELVAQLPRPPFKSITLYTDSLCFGASDNIFTWEEAERIHRWLGKVLGKGCDYERAEF